MINTIGVSAKRGLFPEKINLGTIGENNATELVFVLPESLSGYSVELVCETSKGSFVYALDNCRFTLPQELLTDSTLNIQLVLRSEDVVWKSAPCTFTLGPTLDGSGDNVFSAVRTEERNKTTAELAESLSKVLATATGENYSGLSFDELLQVVTTLPPTQQEQELVEWAKHEQWIISRCKSMPAALNSEFYLTEDEQNGIITGEAAKYIDPESKTIKLPRYDTLNVPWDNNIFGSGTTTATKQLQKAAKITQDGLAGSQTIRAAYVLLAKEI